VSLLASQDASRLTSGYDRGLFDTTSCHSELTVGHRSLGQGSPIFDGSYGSLSLLTHVEIGLHESQCELSLTGIVGNRNKLRTGCTSCGPSLSLQCLILCLQFCMSVYPDLLYMPVSPCQWVSGSWDSGSRVSGSWVTGSWVSGSVGHGSPGHESQV